MKVIYIAGPFRHKSAWGVEQNIRKAEQLGFDVAALGAVPLIPHTMYRFFDGTLTDRFWLEATQRLLVDCDALITVLDWDRSEGTHAEVAWCKANGVPVFHFRSELRSWLAQL